MLVNDGSGGGLVPPYKAPTANYAVEAEIQIVQAGGSFRISARDGGVRGELRTGGCCGDGISLYIGDEAVYKGIFVPFTQASIGPGWHTYRLEVEDNTPKLLFDGSPKASATDNRLISGFGGQTEVLVDAGPQLNLRRFAVIALGSGEEAGEPAGTSQAVAEVDLQLQEDDQAPSSSLTPETDLVRPTAVASESATTSTAEAQVDARQGWQATGATIAPGATVRVEVVGGQWTQTQGQTPPNPGQGWDYVCADALPADRCVEPLPDFRQGALIGRIGSQVFGFGAGATVAAQESGDVQLRINDGDDRLSDNRGVLTVLITIE